jgi:hypothetical protein
MRHGNLDDRSRGPVGTWWWGLGILSLELAARWPVTADLPPTRLGGGWLLFGISVLPLGHFMAWDLLCLVVSWTEHEGGKGRQESGYLWGRLATQARPATADRTALAYQLRFRLCGERKIT